MKTTLFVSRNDIIKRSNLGGGIDPDRLVPSIYVAQQKYVLPTLGTVLYNKLQSDIESGSIANQYKTLLEDYVTDTLVQYTVVEYLPFSIYHIGQAGVLAYQNENMIKPDKRDVDFLLQKSLQSAQYFNERLTDYLIANNPDFPEYWQVTGKSDMIYPDKQGKYNVGWRLNK
jgi:hypothetical protein